VLARTQLLIRAISITIRAATEAAAAAAAQHIHLPNPLSALVARGLQQKGLHQAMQKTP
jgi:hypothetical protein